MVGVRCEWKKMGCESKKMRSGALLWSMVWIVVRCEPSWKKHRQSRALGCSCGDATCAISKYEQVVPGAIHCICEFESESDRFHQCAWSSWVEGCSEGEVEGCAAFWRYLRDVYGVSEASRVNGTALGFFWKVAPHLSEVPPLEACNECGPVMRPRALFVPKWDFGARPTGGVRISDFFYGLPSTPLPLPPAVPKVAPSIRRSFPGACTNAARRPLFDVVLDETSMDPLTGDARARNVGGLGDGAWVEVIRIARRDDKWREGDHCFESQIWFWVAPGSGIWYNLGKTLVLPPKYTKAGRQFMSCRQAMSAGYDSIQIPMYPGTYAYELVACSGANLTTPYEELVSWWAACPPKR